MPGGRSRPERAGPSGGPLIQEDPMLETITVLLVLLWLLGMITSNTMAGWIHLLLVLAVIVVLFRLLSGRRVV
jgi:uncharacterized protein DUF5670